VTLEDTVTGEQRELAANGVFVAIGHKPNTDLFADAVTLDENGYIVKHADEPNVPASARGEFSGRKGELAPAESGATEFSADNVSRGHARLPD